MNVIFPFLIAKLQNKNHNPQSQFPTMNRRIIVFSGGSAANSLVDVFGKVAEDKHCSLS